MRSRMVFAVTCLFLIHSCVSSMMRDDSLCARRNTALAANAPIDASLMAFRVSATQQAKLRQRANLQTLAFRSTHGDGVAIPWNLRQRPTFFWGDGSTQAIDDPIYLNSRTNETRGKPTMKVIAS